VELTIAPDGTYRYFSARTIGVLQGKGTLAIQDGRLTSATSPGFSGRLVERDGKSVLQVRAVAENGVEFSADLTRRAR
jgi:hypothetical protein